MATAPPAAATHCDYGTTCCHPLWLRHHLLLPSRRREQRARVVERVGNWQQLWRSARSGSSSDVIVVAAMANFDAPQRELLYELLRDVFGRWWRGWDGI